VKALKESQSTDRNQQKIMASLFLRPPPDPAWEKGAVAFPTVVRHIK